MSKSSFPRFFLILAMLFCSEPMPLARATAGIRVFTDFAYLYDQNTASNFFQVHDLDLFVSGQIDNRVNYLAEINFQPAFDGLGVDVERTFAQYTVNPWFKVALGRFHTALGYWNDTFHHGSYLQTAATRPVMERFEDTGGLLPVHTTGIEIRGNGILGAGNIGYIFDIGNGRGPVPDPPASFFSYNKSKSVSAVVYYEFDSGLRLGVNGWRSDLPGGSILNGDGSAKNTACVPGPMGVSAEDPLNSMAGPGGLQFCGPKGTEYITGVHGVYNSPNIEWLNEYALMKHRYVDGWKNSDLSTNTTLHLLYSQFGYHLGLFTPYMRYELDATSGADAFLNANPGYNAQGLPATTRYYTIGSRYELSSSSALKLEVRYTSSNAPIYKVPGPVIIPPVIAGSPTSPNLSHDLTIELNWSLIL